MTVVPLAAPGPLPRLRINCAPSTVEQLASSHSPSVGTLNAYKKGEQRGRGALGPRRPGDPPGQRQKGALREGEPPPEAPTRTRAPGQEGRGTGPRQPPCRPPANTGQRRPGTRTRSTHGGRDLGTRKPRLKMRITLKVIYGPPPAITPS